jgi:hypothetical protein
MPVLERHRREHKNLAGTSTSHKRIDSRCQMLDARYSVARSTNI